MHEENAIIMGAETNQDINKRGKQHMDTSNTNRSHPPYVDTYKRTSPIRAGYTHIEHQTVRRKIMTPLFPNPAFIADKRFPANPTYLGSEWPFPSHASKTCKEKENAEPHANSYLFVEMQNVPLALVQLTYSSG